MLWKKISTADSFLFACIVLPGTVLVTTTTTTYRAEVSPGGAASAMSGPPDPAPAEPPTVSILEDQLQALAASRIQAVRRGQIDRRHSAKERLMQREKEREENEKKLMKTDPAEAARRHVRRKAAEFDEMDLDGDHELDFEEFCQAVLPEAVHGDKYSREDKQRWWQAIDIDGDVRLSLEGTQTTASLPVRLPTLSSRRSRRRSWVVRSCTHEGRLICARSRMSAGPYHEAGILLVRAGGVVEESGLWPHDDLCAIRRRRERHPQRARVY